MSPVSGDNGVIRDMKRKMLEKLESRYSDEQIKIIKICTLLDVRHKNDSYVRNDYEELYHYLGQLVTPEQQQQSQHEFPATEGQEINNLSLIGNIGRSNTSIFEYKDDEMPLETPSEQWDTLQHEVLHYKSIRMSKNRKKIQMF